MARVDVRGDIGVVVDANYILQFCTQESLDFSHQISENSNPLFALGHEALSRLGVYTFDSGGLYRPFNIGIKIYEVLAPVNYVQPSEVDRFELSTEPTNADDIMSAGEVTARLAVFIPDEETFKDTLERTKRAMHNEAPILEGVVKEIAEKHLGHEKGPIDIALKGASVMRALHIRAAENESH